MTAFLGDSNRPTGGDLKGISGTSLDTGAFEQMKQVPAYLQCFNDSSFSTLLFKACLYCTHCQKPHSSSPFGQDSI